MEVEIGIVRSAGELVVSTGETPDEVQELIVEALATKDGLLTLVDDRGRRVPIPAAHVAYVAIGEDPAPVPGS